MMHNLHEVVSRIGECWTLKSNACKMIDNIDTSMTLINELAVYHEHHIIKHIPNICGGLVNSEDNSFVLLVSKVFE